MKTRRGTTLIELMVVITGCAALLSLSGQLLHRALKNQSESRRYFDLEHTAWRLAHDFRRDVNAAETATTPDADDALLRLELPADRRVAYSRDGASLVRTLTRADGPPARETYALPEGAVVAVEFDEQAQLITLSVTGESTKNDQAPPTRINDARLAVDAVAQLNRDGRFEASGRGEEETP
jgi:hypothetical protein